MNPSTPESVGYTNNSPQQLAYWENIHRTLAYLKQVESWRFVAVPLANQCIEPPPPPVPPFAVIGYEDSTGGALLKETTDYVYPRPDPIIAKHGPLPGTCAIKAGCYQEPGGRIWVSSNEDTVAPGIVVTVAGIPGLLRPGVVQ